MNRFSRLISKHAAQVAGPGAELPLAIAAGTLLAIGFVLWRVVDESHAWALHNLGHVLVWVSLALGAVHGGRAAWESLRTLRPDIDVLMVVGAALAAAIGHPEEGALLLFMFTLAGALEHRALARAKDAVARLSKLMPTNALVRRHDQWVEMQPEHLVAGDVVLVRPGESIPADGLVIDGQSDLDQSSLTGESFPRAVGVGDEVFAGTINQNGALEIKVGRPVAESSIQRILKLVLAAQESRQPLQRVIDRFSTPYAVTVLVIALLAWIGFMLLGPRLSFAEASYRAITLLVVASPCALVIATPTATLCGLSRAARSGVLIKGGDALERLANVRQVALDKTGTLTTGQIEVTHVEPIGATDADSLLSIAMAAEQRSTHPIASAIVRLAQQHALHPAELASLTNVPGQGVEGTFRGQPVRIGNLEFCEPVIPICFRRHTQRIVERIESGGGKPVVIAQGGGEGQVLVLSLSDTPREGAAELTRELREVGVRSVTMLTGDTKVIAERLAKQLGIEAVHAELLPEEKVQEIRRLRESQGNPELTPNGVRGGLAVVGDGVNDAPSLAVADVGLAMGGIGAEAALETADVVLLHDDLNRIPWSIGLARRVKRIMIANLAFATIVIAALALVTVAMGIPLSLGVLGHEGSTLLVVANSLRLLAHRDP
jgi:Cd2+/Zn2+-exporting ATPase